MTLLIILIILIIILKLRLVASRNFKRPHDNTHTCHVLPPSEIDGGLFLAVFTGSEGKKLFHRIGRKGRIWQL